MMRILVVEDEFVLAMDLEQELADLGCQVVGPAGRRDHALSLAGTEPIDGALLDINLNNGDTFETAGVLQARGIPIAFVTGYRDRALPGPLAEAPRRIKPVTTRELRDILARFAATRS